MRDVRVLEIAGSLAGSYCGRLFATTGADVVVVEPAEGAPLRRQAPFLPGNGHSATHEYLDAGKRSVVIDLDGPRGDTVLQWADVVIVSVNGDAGTARALHRRVASSNPAAVVVVLSGFGLDGPYASWKSSPLIDWAAGGWLYLTGDPDREPVQGGGPFASFLTGATAAVGAQAALLERTRTGRGQLVDVGAMEAIAAAHQWTITMYTHIGAVKKRWGLRFGESFHPMSMYLCRDGWIMIGAASREQWERLCLTADAAELLLDEDLLAPAARFERADEIDEALQRWLSGQTADDAVEALQANRVPASKVNSYAEVLRSEQPAARDAWLDRPDLGASARMPVAPFRLEPGPPTRAGRPAPALGHDTATFLAQARHSGGSRSWPVVDLASVKVLEFSIAWAGPLTARFLADLGAEVLKVEHPASRGVGSPAKTKFVNGPPDWAWGTLPDPQIRAEVFPAAVPGERWWNRSGVFNKMNRNKRSLCIDAKTDDGRRILQELITRSDLVVHNFTPRGAVSLGIDPASLAARNAGIASVAMTGYGETGPMATHSSYGPVLEAYVGIDEATGYLGDGPMRLGFAFPDAVGGLHGTFAALAALWERAHTGRAVHVDLSQLETLLSFVGAEVLATSVSGAPPARRGNRSHDAAPQGVYRCAGDDDWIAVTVADDDEWRALVDVVADPALVALRSAGLAERVARHDDLDAAIARWTAGRTHRRAAADLQAAGVSACPVFSNRDLCDDEHLTARGFVVEWDQVDVGPARFPGFPIHFERVDTVLRTCPALGGDNEATLMSLGYDDATIARLRRDEVIADRPPW